jgi:hypothetical protein
VSDQCTSGRADRFFGIPSKFETGLLTAAEKNKTVYQNSGKRAILVEEAASFEIDAAVINRVDVTKIPYRAAFL